MLPIKSMTFYSKYSSYLERKHLTYRELLFTSELVGGFQDFVDFEVKGMSCLHKPK